MKKIQVLCVDDSALMRGVMGKIINAQPDMEVVATAPDPIVARELIKRHNPDVLTLDVEMPHMDGLEFLQRLMRLRPMPVVMVSAFTAHGSQVTLRALELGAVDFVEKPTPASVNGLRGCADAIVEKIRAAAMARPRRTVAGVASSALAKPAGVVPSTLAKPAGAPRTMLGRVGALIAIGASTGGPEALREVLQGMPAHSPPIFIVQHMPAGFTRSFVQRLDSVCAVRVHEASNGQKILPGNAYLAPGGIAHMKLARHQGGYQVVLEESAPVNRHRPSVDVLFHSVAQVAGHKALGVLLTGMGKDGAQGLLAMRRAGSVTFAQDEASCVVFGMPREALHIGAAGAAVALSDISARILASL